MPAGVLRITDRSTSSTGLLLRDFRLESIAPHAKQRVLVHWAGRSLLVTGRMTHEASDPSWLCRGICMMNPVLGQQRKAEDGQVGLLGR